VSLYQFKMGVMLWVSSLLQGEPVVVLMVMGMVMAGARSESLPPPAAGENCERLSAPYENAGIVRIESVWRR